MRLIRYRMGDAEEALGAVVDEQVYNLTELDASGLTSLSAILRASAPVGQSIERLREVVSAQNPTFELHGLIDSGHQRVGEHEARLLSPIDRQEVWAAGVTYKRSEEARMAESEGAAVFYANVYEADRPELFLKTTPHRVVGAHDSVGIRADSDWNVPEPELGVILTQGLEVLGYTVGNDMSSRSIEGENPLYLPQAKVYDRCCALGPVVLIADQVPDPHALQITLRILREGKEAYTGRVSTADMHRRIEELISYLGRANTFPHGVVLLTGTGIVPDDDFTLQEDDVVEIEIEGIGTLKNRVQQVG